MSRASQARLPLMGPAEVVASLKEFCIDHGPRITTEGIVAWIDRHGGYESRDELIRYAKKMKARVYARRLMFEDEETGLKVKRLWSFRDPETGNRYYHDIAQMPEERRRRLIRQYAKFLEQLRSVRKAMSDYFAGQEFFDFYGGDEEDADEPMIAGRIDQSDDRSRPRRRATRPAAKVKG